MVDIMQGILNGFATGIGVGIANYLIIKRFEIIEKRIQAKINEIGVLNGRKKAEGQSNSIPKEDTSKQDLFEFHT